MANGEAPIASQPRGAERHDDPRTGRPGIIGTLVTKRCLAASWLRPDAVGRPMLRAYDKATGKDAGAAYMPALQTGSPMTYMLNGAHWSWPSAAAITRELLASATGVEHNSLHILPGTISLAGVPSTAPRRRAASHQSIFTVI